MDFNMKDVKSWATRNEVKIRDEGYFFNDIDNAKNDDCYCKPVRGTVEYIRDNYCYCFGIDKRGLKENYSFFLPLEAVRKAQRFRPFINIYELYKLLSPNPVSREDFCNKMILGLPITYRDKKTPGHVTTILISKIDYYSEKNLYYINNNDLDFWFDNFEININYTWRPFGVASKEENDD